MVKFDLVLTKGKIRIETIDDAESTPGTSRQYIRFNAECKPDLEKWGAEYVRDDPMVIEKFFAVLCDHMFEKRAIVHVKDNDGNLTNRIRVFIDTLEVPDERTDM